MEERDLWLELLADSETVKGHLLESLRAETNELISIFISMTKNVKKRRLASGKPSALRLPPSAL